MKRIFISSVALSVLALAPAFAQRKATIQDVPEIQFTTVPNFLKLPPGEYLGEAVAVATNSKGHLFVYHRSGNTRLFEFDEKGNYVREIGEGLYGFEFAHSVRVDPEDNIWAVDEGTNMVIKFNPAGKVGMPVRGVRNRREQIRLAVGRSRNPVGKLHPLSGGGKGHRDPHRGEQLAVSAVHAPFSLS